MEISVSLDPAMGKELEGYINEINQAEGISFHLDVMDGRFVERKSVTVRELEFVMEAAKHPVDVHLMISELSEYMNVSRENLPRSICFHVEAVAGFMALMFIGMIKSFGIQAGVAIDLGTDAGSVNPALISACDVVTIMSVKAGKSGQSFNQEALQKVAAVKKINPRVRVILDGGINAENIETVKKAGVDTAVMGSALFKLSSQERSALLRKPI